MFSQVVIFGFGFLLSSIASETCPNGGQIFHHGISEKGKVQAVNLHNEFRIKIATGNVPGQPRGINLKRISYDETLGNLAKNVSARCKLESIGVHDDRYGQLGLNLYQMSAQSRIGEEDWSRPLNSWYNDYKKYTYGNITESSGGGSFTQLVWAASSLIGCDYIQFYDANSDYPYKDLYNCLYAPAGNIIGRPPYTTGNSGCENLC